MWPFKSKPEPKREKFPLKLLDEFFRANRRNAERFGLDEVDLKQSKAEPMYRCDLFMDDIKLSIQLDKLLESLDLDKTEIQLRIQ
jgi:hypothetical protein